MKPLIHKGSKPGQESYYLNIPREIVRALGITSEDEFVLSVENRDGDIVLCYRRVKKSQ
ncbi:hypothetical protein [Sulfolobus acidocaldarius]|uniref:Conserved protein n=1 Tax=Sulfolobus acidocaldarius (strain ATCC 33909 / DSM 639 / JCM 8929 / NBRC 15157 / NCIMB 11770) TaxID=330779 RepID=Q4J8N2_SULAC|nr:hypothetical protein [Sulfolobus acidocaldarius]AAY80845.1 conserved protein [Sulfolobus acidocaldarius DSM 639]WCM35356.1 AbrB/MazE/SpoVT family DNA-binding domain-containing protein [Sulfolobus acidocaldarius DSM 639]